MLDVGEVPPIEELLLLNAYSALNRKELKLAVLESFQSLEIFLENLLIAKFVLKGLSEADAKTEVTAGNNWRTPERLKTVLDKAVRQRLSTAKPNLWTKWHDKYENVRNEVIHHNKQVTEEEANSTLEINMEVMKWLKTL